jgi:hypothetical protein
VKTILQLQLVLILMFGICVFADQGANPQSDKELSEKIIGIWVMDFKEPAWYLVNGTVTYKTNGSCIWDSTIIDHGEKHREIMKGNWLISNGILTESITNSIGIPKEIHSKGNGPRARIISIDKETLVERIIILREITNSAGYITLYRKNN